jgi:hypothetical protein
MNGTEQLLEEWVIWYETWLSSPNPTEVYDPPIDESKQHLTTIKTLKP